VLDFLLMDDAWVVAFCDAAGLPYEAPMRARAALPGGGRGALDLAETREEGAQERGRLLGGEAVVDLGHVMRLGMGEDARPVRHAARLRVGRAVVEPRDAGLADGGGAHRAGLERHVEVAAREPFGPEPRAAARIARISAWAVGSASSRVRLPAAASTGPSGVDDDRAHGHLAPVAGGAGLGQRAVHVAAEHHAALMPRRGPPLKPLSSARARG
jgi:hypothetical protein